MSTTRQIFPDEGTGNTTVDGVLSTGVAAYSTESQLFNETNANLVDATSTTSNLKFMQKVSSPTLYSGLAKFVMTFDTSILGSTAVIASAYVHFYIHDTPSNGAGSPDLHITSASIASNNNLQASDFARSNFGSTSYGSITYPLSTGNRQIDLNASGITAINKTGITSFAIRSEWDRVGSYNPESAGTTQFAIRTTDYRPGIGSDIPYLWVVYSAAPIVVTNNVKNLGTTACTGQGNVTNDEGETITERGFCWSTSPNPTTSDSKVVVSGTIGAYEGSITGLSASTTYNVRAYAINSIGTSYGSNVEFTTKSGDFKPKTFILT